MAKTSAERKSDPFRTALGAALGLTSGLVPLAPARAESPLPLDAVASMLGGLAWWVVTAGTALAALVAFGVHLRSNRDSRLRAAREEIGSLRTALDRTRVLLDADDQKTLVFEGAAADVQLFGGLPERIGAPVGKPAFLAFDEWLAPESAASLETAIDKLRRAGEVFQIAIRSESGTVLEASGRTSGRRAIVRLRELTGERRSFAELKEQAVVVINEVGALRALADVLPIPLWRRNRAGRLTWVNAAYVSAVEAESQASVLTAGIELLPIRTREAIRETIRAGTPFRDSAVAIIGGARRELSVLDVPIQNGSVGAALDVSELEEVRRQFKRLTDSNAQTFDHLAAGVVLFGRDGRILFYNAAFRAIWGLSAEWLATGPEESAILDQLRADRKLPEQSNYRDWRSKHLAAYQANEQREELWHLPDGRTLRVVALPNADGGMTYLYENVTQEILLESRLTALSELQGETLDHLSEAVGVFGSDGRLRLFNPVFAEIWHLSPKNLEKEPHIGEIITACETLHSDGRAWDAIRTAVTDFDHEDPTSGRMERPDGSVIDYATVALPEGMTMLTFVDVTDSAHVERMLKERNEALEAADRLKSDFIQHVSYELRSPLQNIIGQTEVLAAETFGRLNVKQREYMTDITGSSHELLALINDILDLATVDAGIMALDVRETSIKKIISESVEGLRDRLKEQRIKLKIVAPKDIGAFHADPQRIRQILFNLVSNAIRFSNAGGSIRVEAAKHGNVVTFTVVDNGVGIPEDMIPSVFRPFETRATQGHRGGAGLGLSIVKSLVELHGGEVSIHSEEGKGTTAIVRLPVMPAAVAVAAE